MVAEHIDLSDPRIEHALEELRQIVLKTYPSATFEVGEGDDPCGMYMEVTLDVAETDDAIDLILERLVHIQVEEELPVYVWFVRTPARIQRDVEVRQRLAGIQTPGGAP